MLTIYKYELEITGSQWLEMPQHAEILCVKTQRNKICAWARVNTERDLFQRRIIIVGTGSPMMKNDFIYYKYIDTVELSGGDLIFHIFEGGEVAIPKGQS